jgi:hypothetical protein
VKKIVTDQRSQLGIGKEGHSQDSATSDSSGVRNTLCALLMTKDNIFHTVIIWRFIESFPAD